MTTVVDVLKKTEVFFRARGIPSPRLDAELIVGHHLGLERVALYLQFDRPLSESELHPMRADVQRRADREPVAWILDKGVLDTWISTATRMYWSPVQTPRRSSPQHSISSPRMDRASSQTSGAARVLWASPY